MCVRKLSNTQQEIVQLRFGEGLRCKEIAHIIGKSERATRALLYRALKQLRASREDIEKPLLTGPFLVTPVHKP